MVGVWRRFDHGRGLPTYTFQSGGWREGEGVGGWGRGDGGELITVGVCPLIPYSQEGGRKGRGGEGVRG